MKLYINRNKESHFGMNRNDHINKFLTRTIQQFRLGECLKIMFHSIIPNVSSGIETSVKLQTTSIELTFHTLGPSNERKHRSM